MDAALRARVEELTGGAVTSASSVGGGDFATAYRVELSGGAVVFVKTHRNPPSNFFSTEAAGLEWLAEPGVINVAHVIAVADDDPACLVLDWIDVGGQPSSIGEFEFGRALAALHRTGAEKFGREDGRTTGSQALPNTPCDTWAEFYADRRLLSLARIAHDRSVLPRSTIDRLEHVANRLGEFGGADEPPARLHGDLWAGNRVVAFDGSSWILDPAAHGGHREFDLAMMQLFGGFGRQCFEAYDEAYPLAAGWEERVPLHQLAPLVVHAIKFSGGYVDGVARALESVQAP